MLVKVEDAQGLVLDWLVAKCEGGYDLQLRNTYGTKTAWQYTILDEEEPERMDRAYLADTSYSTDWQLGGSIIDREKIELKYHDRVVATIWYRDSIGSDQCLFKATGPTPLIAAMRCYVVSKLGKEVEVPDGLA